MWRICDSQQLVGPQVRRCGAAEDMSVSDRDRAGAFKDLFSTLAIF
jgi:hypothetical protein